MLENNFIHIEKDTDVGNSITKNTRPITKRTYNKRTQSAFTYNEYVTNNILMDSYTLPILKQVCKSYKLCISGRKQEVIGRITTYFNKIRNAIVLQKYTRRYLVKIVMSKYKENKILRESCVNDTDFSTLDPISEIPRDHLYCYTDTDKFTYGFNITSLIELLHNNQKISNPYNRMPITKKQQNNIVSVYNVSILINPSFKEYTAYYSTTYNSYNRMPPRIQNMNRITPIEAVLLDYNPEPSSYNNYHPPYNVRTMSNPLQFAQYQQIVLTRREPIQTRIDRLFTEIDRLGNYTQSIWFTDLTHLQYARLYRALYDIWNYRGQLSPALKLQICPYHGPFEGIFPITVRHLDLSVDDLKSACLIVFENMIYSGVSSEIRQIGVMHSLTALTIVSSSARYALPWLFESIEF
jgi:hypothetical protein